MQTTTLPTKSPSKKTKKPYVTTPFIQLVPITRISQAFHNPFHHINNSRRIKFSNEFINYKPIEKDDLVINIDNTRHNRNHKEDCCTTPNKDAINRAYETSFGELTQHLRTQTLIPKKVIFTQTSSEIEAEMNMEIKIHTTLSEDVEMQLKYIPHIKPVSLLEIESKRIVLPITSKKHTLILDLDETLICALQSEIKHSLCNNLPVYKAKYFSKSTTLINIVQFVKRSYLDAFLEDASRTYEIVVLTINRFSLPQRRSMQMP